MASFLIGRGIQFLLLSMLIKASDLVCPSGLPSSCECAEKSEGFHIECQGVTGSLESILQSIEKVQIAKLRIFGAHWPVSCFALFYFFFWYCLLSWGLVFQSANVSWFGYFRI